MHFLFDCLQKQNTSVNQNNFCKNLVKETPKCNILVLHVLIIFICKQKNQIIKNDF